MQTFQKERFPPGSVLPLGMCSDLKIYGFFRGGVVLLDGETTLILISFLKAPGVSY